MNHLQLAKEIHENAVNKGFWEMDSNQDEKIMLIITELSEAVESHRKDQWANREEFHTNESHPDSFQKNIKDSVEDELADAYIRCLDFLYRYKKEHFEVHPIIGNWSGNFAADIFKIVRTAISEYDIEGCTGCIESLCASLEIDLEWHVKQKMKYNAQREYKHGKAY